MELEHDLGSRLERGRPSVVVDGLGHYLFSLPSKLALLSWHVDNHHVSGETEQALLAMLDANGLCQVKIRINQYAPGGEWSRLFRNREVGGLGRYTLGVLSLVFYTVLPDRLFGGDSYNAYTNTINLYSDEPAVALHEAGHAQDWAKRSWKGTYAAARLIPLVPLYQEGIGTRRAVSFLRDQRETERERKAYPLLWGAWGTYLAGEIGQWFLGPLALYAVEVPVAWGGRAVGWMHARSVPESAPAPDPVAVQPSCTPPAPPPDPAEPPGLDHAASQRVNDLPGLL